MKNLEGFREEAYKEIKTAADEKNNILNNKINVLVDLKGELLKSDKQVKEKIKVSKEQDQEQGGELRKEFDQIQADPLIKEYFKTKGISSFEDYTKFKSESENTGKTPEDEEKNKKTREDLKNDIKHRGKIKDDLIEKLRGSEDDSKVSGRPISPEGGRKIDNLVSLTNQKVAGIKEEHYTEILKDLLSGKEEIIKKFCEEWAVGSVPKYNDLISLVDIAKLNSNYSILDDFKAGLMNLADKIIGEMSIKRERKSEEPLPFEKLKYLIQYKMNLALNEAKNTAEKLDSKIWNEELSKKIEVIKPKAESLFNNLLVKLSSDRQSAGLIKGFGYNGEEFYVTFDQSKNNDLVGKVLNAENQGYGDLSVASDGLEGILSNIEDSAKKAKDGSKEASKKVADFNNKGLFYKMMHSGEKEVVHSSSNKALNESRRFESAEDLLKSVAEFLEGMKSLKFGGLKLDFNTNVIELSELKKIYFEELDKKVSN